MKNFFSGSRIFSIVCLFLNLCISNISAIPINNRYDPYPVYNVLGSDKYYVPRDSFQCSIQLTPFYQTSSGARNEDGEKVPEGDILGRWNMFGLFYGYNYQPAPEASVPPYYPYKILAAPTKRPFNIDKEILAGTPPAFSFFIPGDGTNDSSYTQQYYPNLSYAWRVLDDKVETSDTNDPVNTTGLKTDYTDQNAFYPAPPTDLSSIYDQTLPLTYIDYEKYGLRGQIECHLKWGLGLKIRGGVVDYRQVPEFRYVAATDAGTDVTMIRQYLTRPEMIEAIANEVCLGVKTTNKTALEDTHVQLDLFIPFDLKDDDDEIAATLVPYFAIGAWVPTGAKKDINKAFSIPTGNDGYWGGTAECSFGVDFPGTIQLSFGGGAAFFETRDIKDARLPVKVFDETTKRVCDFRQEQKGIYPWRINIKRTPGVVWYFNGSFKANLFIEHFSFFFDYIYEEHKGDTIKLHDKTQVTIVDANPEADPPVTAVTVKREDLFLARAAENESRWKDNLVHCGLNYKVSNGLDIGLAVNAHISGSRVYKNTTILGTMSFNF